MLEFYSINGNYLDAINELVGLLRHIIYEIYNDYIINDINWSFNHKVIFQDNDIVNYEFIEKELIQPTFVKPKEQSPLAKYSNGQAERFELYAGGIEIANGYSEQDNWQKQLKAFEDQKYIDESYINALKIGLPPTFGVGLGIDRLLMLLTGRNIREVI